MADVSASPWWVVLAAAIPSTASGVWVVWRWWAERQDKRHEGVLTREQQLQREMDTARAALSKDAADLFDRLQRELIRTQARLEEVEQDRDRGWDLARWWCQRAHDLRHDGLNAQTMVSGLMGREGDPSPKWPDMTVPALEAPVPRRQEKP